MPDANVGPAGTAPGVITTTLLSAGLWSKRLRQQIPRPWLRRSVALMFLSVGMIMLTYKKLKLF